LERSYENDLAKLGDRRLDVYSGVRLQAADVGIRLVPRKSGTNETETAREHAAEEAFLK
jgi:hypothetical protein